MCYKQNLPCRRRTHPGRRTPRRTSTGSLGTPHTRQQRRARRAPAPTGTNRARRACMAHPWTPRTRGHRRRRRAPWTLPATPCGWGTLRTRWVCPVGPPDCCQSVRSEGICSAASGVYLVRVGPAGHTLGVGRPCIAPADHAVDAVAVAGAARPWRRRHVPTEWARQALALANALLVKPARAHAARVPAKPGAADTLAELDGVVEHDDAAAATPAHAAVPRPRAAATAGHWAPVTALGAVAALCGAPCWFAMECQRALL